MSLIVIDEEELTDYIVKHTKIKRWTIQTVFDFQEQFLRIKGAIIDKEEYENVHNLKEILNQKNSCNCNITYHSRT